MDEPMPSDQRRRCTFCQTAHTMDGDCILAEQDDDEDDQPSEG